jgi:N6-L-threonylcarbamoyladenine synthase
LPDPAYCTDNAAMIGSAAYYRYLRGERAGLDLNAHAVLPLEKTLNKMI